MKTKKLHTVSVNRTFVVCDFCGQQEKGKGYLQRHIDRKHRKLFCNVCNQVYRQKKNLLDHLRSHFERFVCQYCGLEIIRFERFQKHVYQKHEPKNKQLILSIQSRETYECRHCVRTFLTAVHRNCHENAVHKGRSEEAFKCDDCSQVFITKDELRSHSFEHYTGALFFCAFPNCDRFFRTKKQLANHNSIHGPAKHECANCSKRFSQCANLSKHKKRCKGNVSKYLETKQKEEEEDQEIFVKAAKEQFELLGGKLQAEKKKFFSKKEVKSKKVEEPTAGQSSVQVIEYLEEYSDEVKPELKAVEVEIESHFEACAKLENISSDFSEVTVNDISARARSSRIIVCDVCAFQTSSERSFKSHLKSHSLEKTFETNKEIKSIQRKLPMNKNPRRVCDLCGFVSQSKQLLNSHISQHKTGSDVKKNDEDERLFPCGLCGITCKSSLILKNHVKIHETPTECPICHKLLPNMARHLKWHRQPKPDPFRCPQCGKLCTTKQSVQEHIHRIHEKMPLGKTYRCELCDLNFIRNSDLRRHSFIHFAGKIHSCSVPGCHEMFKTAFKLQEHGKVHNPSKEASFGCNLCEKKYLRNTALMKHKRQIHGELPVKFTINIT